MMIVAPSHPKLELGRWFEVAWSNAFRAQENGFPLDLRVECQRYSVLCRATAAAGGVLDNR
jgi:hypothetical protein